MRGTQRFVPGRGSAKIHMDKGGAYKLLDRHCA